MSSWPSTLPQCTLVNGRNSKQPSNRIVTEMSTGAPKIRKRNSATREIFNVSVVVTGAQWGYLMAFFNSTIEFDWLNPMTKAAATCRIMEEPQETLIGLDLYSVTFPLEVR